ncbi:2OG-Fe(II) oxygenase [Caulobacter sp. S45]|uniref:2OG-Fe(II) oxygenase n=1 Tax=Caulobacter sp. S45 TaxID=1641861 RepID=UPI00131E9518|nr:2OG-Fe(II) oxygenase [Caulobacter sp. S45]
MQPPVVTIPRSKREREALAAAAAQFALAQQLDAEGRHDEAVIALRTASDGDHVPAMTFLAGRLLTGRGAPHDPAQGVPLLARAAQAGGADANAMMATLAGAGAGMRQDWNVALGYLQRAAQLGSERAQGQLRVLAGLIGKSDLGPEGWEQARRQVNLAAWITSPPKRVLAEQPRLRVVEGFAPALACDWLISRARILIRPATVYDPETGGPRQESARSNSAAEFDIVQADLVLMLLRERIAAATRLSTLAMEPVQVLHYAVGQQFAPHFDFMDLAVEGYARDAAVRGQRIATFLLYLNDDYEGGETTFPRIGLQHRGRKGDAFFFANVDAENRPDRLTLHAGAPPTAGEKWVLSQWIRDRAPAPMT